MRKKTFKEIYNCIIRIISSVAVIVLTVGIITSATDICRNSVRNVGTYYFIILNFICIVCFVILFFKPHKLHLYAMISVFYAIPNLRNDMNGEIGIGFIMFVLFLISLLAQGFFKRRSIIKILIICLLFALILVSNLIIGFKDFYHVAIYVLGYSLLLSVISLILLKYQKEIQYVIVGHKILDLRNPIMNGLLKARDVKWLKQILNGDKYSAIASESAVSDGTMRNRIREVFKIIGVTDRKQFLTIYDGAIVITTQQEFEEWKNTLV